MQRIQFKLGYLELLLLLEQWRAPKQLLSLESIVYEDQCLYAFVRRSQQRSYTRKPYLSRHPPLSSTAQAPFSRANNLFSMQVVFQCLCARRALFRHLRMCGARCGRARPRCLRKRPCCGPTCYRTPFRDPMQRLRVSARLYACGKRCRKVFELLDWVSREFIQQSIRCRRDLKLSSKPLSWAFELKSFLPSLYVSHLVPFYSTEEVEYVFLRRAAIISLS